MNNLHIESANKLTSVYDVFDKNGKTYECLIMPRQAGATCGSFEITCRNIHHPDLVTFVLTSTPDGHWTPNTKSVDPWMAERVGRIIVDNF